jgi:hypothetical protein
VEGLTRNSRNQTGLRSPKFFQSAPDPHEYRTRKHQRKIFCQKKAEFHQIPPLRPYGYQTPQPGSEQRKPRSNRGPLKWRVAVLPRMGKPMLCSARFIGSTNGTGRSTSSPFVYRARLSCPRENLDEVIDRQKSPPAAQTEDKCELASR